MSANEAAAYFGITPSTYRAAEEDLNGVAQYLDTKLWSACGDIGMPTVGEMCLIAKRRANISMAELCAEFGGCSRPTFNKAEREGHPDIVALWQRKGFSFE